MNVIEKIPFCCYISAPWGDFDAAYGKLNLALHGQLLDSKFAPIPYEAETPDEFKRFVPKPIVTVNEDYKKMDIILPRLGMKDTKLGYLHDNAAFAEIDAKMIYKNITNELAGIHDYDLRPGQSHLSTVKAISCGKVCTKYLSYAYFKSNVWGKERGVTYKIEDIFGNVYASGLTYGKCVRKMNSVIKEIISKRKFAMSGYTLNMLSEPDRHVTHQMMWYASSEASFYLHKKGTIEVEECGYLLIGCASLVKL